MKGSTASDWLSVADLATRFGVPIATIHDWNYKGIAPKRHKFGRHVRYRRVDVGAWEREHEVASPPRPA